MFACPHCGGALHPPAAGLDPDRIAVVPVDLAEATSSADAAWAGVRALEEQARLNRWALQDPDVFRLADPERVEQSARADEGRAAVLRRYAEALDHTLREAHVAPPPRDGNGVGPTGLG